MTCITFLDMSDEKEWVVALYEDLVADQKVRDLVWRHLADIEEAEGPSVLEMDVVAARKYLRKCLLNMPQSEIRGLHESDVAGLWARGAIGAALYRLRKR